MSRDDTKFAWLAGATLALATAGPLGCMTAASLDADVSRSVSRTLLNTDKHACMLPLGACTQLGMRALHADPSSMEKSWSEPLDRALAEKAFTPI
jgi:hypothetical protein